MGRSVMVPRDAVETVYLQFEGDPGDWADFVLDIGEQLRKRFPSMMRSDRPVGDELRCVLEGPRGAVAIAEYCGTVSVSLVPRNSHPLTKHWIHQIVPTFIETMHKAFPQSILIPLGKFSNGEMAYQRTDGQKVVERGDVLDV